MAGTPKAVDAVGVRVGQILLGKYRVESILGQGAMGVVAQCMHIALNERVAIKMLRPDSLIEPGADERFMREARAAVKLKSEYVARVSDGTFENGTPYMVMEYLEGHDLGALLTQRGHLPVPWAAELIMQAAEALSEAHALDIVHRDVKPTNLFVTWRPDGTALIKVLDFGISKAPPGADMHLTNTQSLLGTPAYMSPEQMRSARRVDPRTDIWSLGVVMYELIEGHRPFEAESFTELVVKVSIDAPLPMKNAPPQLQQIIVRCLEKNPDQRYDSMSDVGRDLLPFVTDQHKGVILVERMQRVLRRKARPQRWAEETVKTEPDFDVAAFEKPGEHKEPAFTVVHNDAPAVPGPAMAAPLTPEPSMHPATRIPDPNAEPSIPDDDTVFEVASRHVPPSDRRGDDLVPTPWTAEQPAVAAPVRSATVPEALRGVAPDAAAPTTLNEEPEPRRRLVLILLVALAGCAVGGLVIALFWGGLW